MRYLEFLRELHKRKAGCGLYLEIGCRKGRSLNLSRAKRSIAVDPDFEIVHGFSSPTQVFKQTSDDFFAKTAPRVLKRPIDLAFIDGMHLAEFALRDFINVERHCHEGSIVVLDDVLPHTMEIGARTRNTREWTGDIYKLISVLKEYRPDLTVTLVDIDVKGLMLIQGLDPSNTVLADNYAAIEAELVKHDSPVITVDELRAVAQPVSPAEALALVGTGARPTRAPRPQGSGSRPAPSMRQKVARKVPDRVRRAVRELVG